MGSQADPVTILLELETNANEGLDVTSCSTNLNNMYENEILRDSFISTALDRLYESP